MTSIKTKIWAIAFLAFMIAVTFSVIILNITTRSMEEEERTKIQLLTENAATKMNSYNSVIEKAVDDIVSVVLADFDINKSIADPSGYFESHLERIGPFIREIGQRTEQSTGSYVYYSVETYGDVYGSWYIIENGSFIPSPEMETIEMFIPENENMIWYYKPMLSGKPSWTEIYYDEVLDEDCVSFVMPIFSEGNLVGMAGMDASFEKKKDAIESIKIYETGEAFLTDENGEFVVHPRKIIEDEVIDKVRYSKQEAGSGVYSTEKYIVAYSVIESGSTLWIYAPKSEVFAESHRLSSIMFVLLVVLMFMVMICAYFLTGMVSKPVLKLRDSVNEIIRGNLGVSVNIDSDDEIGELAGMFNSMTQKLRDNQKKIGDYNKNLENQVRERTDELQKKIKELNDTTTAILNMMEDSDSTNKELVSTRDELRKNLEKLRELDKKKDEFISVAAHELKTPLTSIRGFSNLLLERKIFEDIEKREKYLKIIEKETIRLAKLITDILDLSRIDMGTFKLNEEDTDISAIIDDVIKVMYPQIKEMGIALTKEVDEKTPKIMVDKGRLNEIILNLVGNSVKYTEKGSITIKAYPEKNFLHIIVKDTGIGISEKDKPRIFERFYQADSSFTRKAGGTGLGLAISREYLSAMGGTIAFKSEPGKGTEFEFTIPIKTGKKK